MTNMSLSDLQTAFGWEIVRVSEMESNGDFAQAIQVLDKFWDDHRTQDVGGWLQSRVRFHKANILRDSGDLGGAMSLFREIDANPQDRFFYSFTTYCLASVLDALGEQKEAFAELRRRLDKGAPTLDDLDPLTLYTDLGSRLGEPIPPDHWDLIRDVVRSWGVPLEESESRNPASLQAALAAAGERRRERATLASTGGAPSGTCSR